MRHADAPLQAWDARYRDAKGYLFGTEPNAWLTRQTPHWAPGQTALCVADGEGRNSVWLARQGLQVRAFDPSGVAVERARALAAESRVVVDAQVAGVDDEAAWPHEPVDLMVGIFIQFAPPSQRARMFSRMVAGLKPGGRLLLLGYTLEQLRHRTGGPSQPEQLYTDALLRQAFDRLEILSLESFEAEVHEGTGHSGRSALIGLVARRPV